MIAGCSWGLLSGGGAETVVALADVAEPVLAVLGTETGCSPVL